MTVPRFTGMHLPPSLASCLATLKFLGGQLCRHNLLLWASALTYTTLLSLVPFLALAFSLLKGMGLQDGIAPLVLHQLAGNSHDVALRIMEYIRNANTASVGVVGFLFLLVMVLLIMDSITGAFNQICEARETRPFWRLLVEYLTIALAGPSILALLMTMTSLLQSQWLVRRLIEETLLAEPVLLFFRLVPYIVIILSLILLYRFVPNACVSLRSAAIGGTVAGFAWQAAHWGYFHFQFGVTRNNAVYGALAALPFLLVWIYLSWIIVLLGLELAMLHQHGHKSSQSETSP
ncbi:YihY/virulence factor BrkB family protein [Trichlorobacter ammonificans]|uniref:Ribonuclease BN n=1 Tax=Trichlorobacter ammonificans TaxID=2916410 RepID=A0ABM9D5J4_9BACT|nr:YihY/virulence factor BrkB family protein [Trichlorobacter ammonificans]CAH2030436.1 Ribonuclease BN [Trichlorobacter ammonificans]